MSEPRRERDLGVVKDVTAAALDIYTRIARYTPMQKQEILLICQALVNIEIARDQRAKAELRPLAGDQVFPSFREIADE
jgi:hypothetical protein